MVFLVVTKECSNKIYTNDKPEIELISFQTKEDAESYLKYGGNIKNNTILTEGTYVNVFTDGACSNNGKENAKAGIGVYFGENDPRNVSKRIDGKQTNNTAELSAIIEVFNILTEGTYIKDKIKKYNEINIYTDSEYVIKCCTSYGKKCEKNNWKREIPNVELVKLGYLLVKDNPNVKLYHVKAHTGLDDKLSKGNEGADNLANMAINYGCSDLNIEKYHL